MSSRASKNRAGNTQLRSKVEDSQQSRVAGKHAKKAAPGQPARGGFRKGVRRGAA
jgi:hypothetical protein